MTDGNLEFDITGQGSGAIGLPGDASPPSRFVKTAFMLKNVFSADNATVNTDNTQWVVFKDITNKKIYYRTYDDMTLRSIAFDKLDFSKQAPRLKMPLTRTPVIQDKTQEFLKLRQ